jgi:glutathione S-transferase
MSKPELVYFNGRGRAEIIRLTLAAAGIEFNEVHLPSKEFFQSLLPDLLFKQVPMLRMDGMNIVQTAAIVRYIARKANLLGDIDPHIVRVDELFEGTRDAYMGFYGFGFTPDEEGIKQKINTSLDKYLPIYNKVLTENGKGYLVGSSVTIADLGLFEVIQATIDYFTAERFKEFPAIVKWYETVSSLDRIKHYLAHIRKPCNDSTYTGNVKAVLD